MGSYGKIYCSAAIGYKVIEYFSNIYGGNEKEEPLNRTYNNAISSFSVEFKKDKDLMGSIHKSDCSIISIDHHQNGIAYFVELIDDYNFTEFRTDYLQDGLFNAIAWIGNDLAHIDMNAGVLNSYPLIIRIEGILP